MTNEEKVDVLVSDYCIYESDSPEGAQGVRYGAEKMAKWKDQQFKKYLIELHGKMTDEQSLSMPQEDFKKWNKYIRLVQSKIEEL